MTLPDGGAGRLEPTMELIRRAAELAGVPRDEVRLGGIPVVNAALNEESTRSLVRLAGVSGLLGLVIAWLCFRDLRLTMLVLAVGVYSAAASLAVVPLVRDAPERRPHHDGPAGLRDGRFGGDPSVELLPRRPEARRVRRKRPARPWPMRRCRCSWLRHYGSWSAVARLQRFESDSDVRRVLGGRSGSRLGCAVLLCFRRRSLCGCPPDHVSARTAASGETERSLASGPVAEAWENGSPRIRGGNDRVSRIDLRGPRGTAADTHVDPDDAALLAREPR